MCVAPRVVGEVRKEAAAGATAMELQHYTVLDGDVYDLRKLMELSNGLSRLRPDKSCTAGCCFG